MSSLHVKAVFSSPLIGVFLDFNTRSEKERSKSTITKSALTDQQTTGNKIIDWKEVKILDRETNTRKQKRTPGNLEVKYVYILYFQIAS